jgi:hypothetical protein
MNRVISEYISDTDDVHKGTNCNRNKREALCSLTCDTQSYTATDTTSLICSCHSDTTLFIPCDGVLSVAFHQPSLLSLTASTASASAYTILTRLSVKQERQRSCVTSRRSHDSYTWDFYDAVASTQQSGLKLIIKVQPQRKQTTCTLSRPIGKYCERKYPQYIVTIAHQIRSYLMF